uniref:MANEC domain-containing protein n=1 Tax=Caenorhabditis japonica TaxID=281687 RepID=A0A8R1EBN5_CAEJA
MHRLQATTTTTLLLFLVPLVRAEDVFCGELEIFNEQRFGVGAVTVSSQTTGDLKQCLDVCCSIPNCDGVTFEGITSSEFDDANCLLVACEPKCHFNTPSAGSSGVLSVLINRIRIFLPVMTELAPIAD